MKLTDVLHRSSLYLGSGRIHHHLGIALSALSLLACAEKQLPAPGEVVLLLTTDMLVPDSFDTLLVTIDKPGGETLNYAYTDTSRPTGTTNSPCSSANLSSTRLEFPTSIAITSEREEGDSVDISITACKGDRVILARETRRGVAIPPPGHIQLLRAPIQWLCANRNTDCLACGNTQSSCFHQTISPVEPAIADTTCRAKQECDQSLASAATVPYNANEVARYTGRDNSGHDCFDPFTCFDLREESEFEPHVWRPVAVGWSPEPASSPEPQGCVARLESAFVGSNKLNLALVLPPGAQGYCDKVRCVVPLAANADVGWKLDSAEQGRVSLPAAVCHMLDTGQILSVMGSVQCASKSAEIPFCGTPTEANTPPDSTKPINLALTNSLVLHVPFDESADDASVLKNEFNQALLRRDVGDPSKASKNIALVGRAAAFSSRSYAHNLFAPTVQETFSWSVWVSPTALDAATRNDPTDAVMPILSNVAEDCLTGGRVQLRACNHRSSLVLEFGIPIGRGNSEKCQMRYIHAPVASRTYAGGFSTPWQDGNFYHIAITHDAKTQRSQLFVDGASRDATSADCALPSADEPSDGSAFYLGTSAAALAPATETSHVIILDELKQFDVALTPEDVKWLYLDTATVSGPSGLRWGNWATQGSVSQMESETLPLSFRVQDNEFSCGGGFALLGEPQDLTRLSTDPAPVNLSDYDEAVFVASVPTGKPFQFALGETHGQRQCTWQLNGKAKETDADNYVINLRAPSWCIDAKCTFDPKLVGMVSFGTDWETGSAAQLDFQVKALAFRKRPALPNTASAASERNALGGVPGPTGWCWKPVTYDPTWELGPVSVTDSGVVGLERQRDYGESHLFPELAADLPDLGGRDLSACAAVQFYLLVDATAGSVDAPKLVMQNDLGQNYTWDITDAATTDPATIATVMLVNAALTKESLTPSRVVLLDNGVKYPQRGPNVPTDQQSILKNVTRISVQYDHPIYAFPPISCCATVDGPCEDLLPTP